MADDRREFIFELAEKYKFLRESKIAQRLCGHNGSVNSFCKKLGIPRRTLLDSAEAGRLTSKHQGVLATKCKFSLNWVEWNDPHADSNAKLNRRDTCKAFIAKYHAEHPAEEQPKSSPRPAKTAPLNEDLLAKTERYQCQLASLSLRFGQTEQLPGEAMLTFDLNCPKVAVEGFLTGVRQGILTFHCGAGFTTEVKDRTGYDSGVEFNGAKFTIQDMDKRDPSWLVTASGDSAIGIIGDAAQTFIRIMNLAPGESVSADFTVYVRDIATTFVLPEGQNQSVAKQRVRKRLRDMRLTGREDGYAMAALAEIKFATWEV
jgi:hypothetical protein